MNAAQALGVAHALGLDLEMAVASLRSFSPPPRRLQRWRVDTGEGALEVIDDGYNAAPASTRALLDVMRARADVRRKVLVLGDMRELGQKERELHEALAEDTVSAGISFLVTVGPLARLLAAKLEGIIETRSFESSDQAAAEIRALVRPGDLVAVKGSNAVKLHLVVQALFRDARRRAARDWMLELERDLLAPDESRSNAV
jgi:UDP-N-acetylmuramoyl-tripeptide--D-alanyl-D-alanine ligase